REFRRIDESLTKMASKTVAALVASGKPRMDAKDKPADFGEVGALNTEMSKRSRHKPIRKLIAEIPTILPKLKPCLLMSPLSVAQYLDASHPPFDVVVFDEASQIPVSDAIGVMARGKQVIVTGDPQQLPPTSFFQRGMELSDEEFTLMEAEGIPEDAESILDECRARGLPDINLAWHYRSKHESLIAFSNHHYYGGSLLTNPEPEIRDEGVKLVSVDGVYDRGKSRTNLREAEEVVKAIAAHYRDEKLHGVSIGVVTFNSQQQSLIETLLDAERQKDAELDMLIANDEREPLFIKNLENVQGDERDVIIFSTTYGKDESGRPSNNFGPINKPGGHRRLNVAITRARLGVVVFTSLRPEDIDLSRTKERGPRHLKAYLEFAARGKLSLPAIIKGESRDEYDSGFELKVAEALRSQGWEVHTQIGCSSYRIDLAVVHPEHAGAYAIGIECDGATYHSSATARDRDRLRQSVLERLGWRIHRVWSTDWFRDYEKEKTRLFEAVSKAIENYSPDGAHLEQEQEEAVKAPAESEAQDAKSDEPIAEAAKAPDSAGVPYQMVQISQTMKGLDPYNPATVEALRFAIASVVDKEGPVALTLLCERIAAILEMKRSTTKLKDRLSEILPRNIPRTKTSSNTFIWSSKAGPDAYKEFRVHDGNDDFRRALSDICPQEQANAMEHVVRSYQSVPTEDLLRQVVLLFGYNNLTQQMKDMLRPGLKQLEKRKGIQKTSSGYAFKG
ncbi:MAG: DUF3320 domain-containing protein, partial [Opitutales bacterium]|nr:DUF3320 domain-containing protein [Opitutales bacterium]